MNWKKMKRKKMDKIQNAADKIKIKFFSANMNRLGKGKPPWLVPTGQWNTRGCSSRALHHPPYMLQGGTWWFTLCNKYNVSYIRLSPLLPLFLRASVCEWSPETALTWYHSVNLPTETTRAKLSHMHKNVKYTRLCITRSPMTPLSPSDCVCVWVCETLPSIWF